MTSPLTVHCTHCGKAIKIPDDSYLGKMGKCPKCHQKFRIELASEETAPFPVPEITPPPPAKSQKSHTPVVDTPVTPAKSAQVKPATSEPQLARNARWIPNSMPVSPVSPAPTGTPAFTGKSAHAYPPIAPIELSALSSAAPIPAGENEVDNPFAFNTAGMSTAPVPGFPVTDPAGIAPVAVSAYKRKKKSSLVSNLVVLIMFLAAGGAGYFYYTNYMQNQQTNLAEDNTSTPQTTAANDAEVVVFQREKRKNAYQELQELNPTQGPGISLQLLPAGVRMLIHLRPAEIFGDDDRWAEIRACLGPLMPWVETNIKNYCFFTPDKIESVLFGIVLGPRGSIPDVACVVHLKEEIKLREFLDQTQSIPQFNIGDDVYVTGRTAFLVQDPKTIAFCPNDLIQDVIDFRGKEPISTEGLKVLSPQINQSRHIMIAFENEDLLQHLETLFAENTRPFVKSMLEWIGDDVETTLYSVQVDEPFYAELLVRNTTITKPVQVEQQLQEHLAKLPQELVTLTRKMRPRQKGYQQLIGRLPAMMEVFTMCTESAHDSRAVRFLTLLPAKAAPNLATASLLSWDESTRTNFAAADIQMATKDESGKNLPKGIAARMNTKIDVEFSRTPLQDAFDYIANEVEIKVEIDGDALKSGAYTKNMPQTFSKQQATVAEICQEIVKKYNQTEVMCISIDEKTDTLHVLTVSAAKARGMKVYEF
jgi:phage FluMu protein Com